MPTVDLGLVVGSNGQGVPTGGSAGQILAKNSSSNYDTGWVPMSAAAAAAFGIVETGNAASQTIAAGQYVIWKGVLYTADAAIASGTTLAASGGNKNLTAVSGGGLNAVKASVDSLNSKFVTEQKTSSELTVNANDRGVFTIDVSKSGYTPIGILQVALANNWMYVGGYSIAGNNAQVVIHNGINRSAGQQTVYITVLYQKN